MITILRLLCIVSGFFLILGIKPLIRSAYRDRSLASGLLIMAWLGLLLWRTRDAESLMASPFDIESSIRIFSPIIIWIVYVPMILINSRLQRAILSAPLVFLLMYCGMAMLSAFYSAYPGYSLFKGFEYCALIFLASHCVLLNKNQFQGFVDTLILLAVLTLLSAVMWGALLPTTSFYETWGPIGFSLQGQIPIVISGAVGTFSALTAGISFYRIFELEDRLHYSYLALGSTLMLILAQSRTCIFMLSSMLLVLFVVKRKILLVGLVCLASVSWFFIEPDGVGDLFTAYILRGQTLAQFQQLSGRMARWDVAWDMFKEAPISGYGFSAASRITMQQYILTGTGNTHGTWIEVMIGLGLVGLLFLILYCLSSFFRIIKHSLILHKTGLSGDYHLATELMLILFALMLQSFTSTELAYLSHSAIFAITVAAFIARHKIVLNKNARVDSVRDKAKMLLH